MIRHQYTGHARIASQSRVLPLLKNRQRRCRIKGNQVMPLRISGDVTSKRTSQRKRRKASKCWQTESLECKTIEGTFDCACACACSSLLGLIFCTAVLIYLVCHIPHFVGCCLPSSFAFITSNLHSLALVQDFFLIGTLV